jgi:outer membrane protein, heavy metal efflux system
MRSFLNINAVLILLISSISNASTFDEYVERLNKHPQVESISSESETMKMLSLGELGLPDPVLMTGAKNIPISRSGSGRFDPTASVYGISQMIPNPISRKAKSEKFSQSSKKKQLIAIYTKERLRFILIAKMAEYKNLKTQRIILKKQLEYYKDLDITFKGQIESGRSVYKRFSEVDVERAKSELELNNINAGITAVKADFISLIDEVPEIEVPEVLDKKWNKDPNILYPVMISAQDILISHKNIKIAEAAFYPNFGINASYKQSEDNKDGLSVQASVSIPLWASKNQEPKRKAAEAEETSAKFACNDAKRLWTQQLIALQSVRDAAASNIKVLQDQDIAMKSKVDASQRNYESGTENLDNILFAKIDRLNIQSKLSQVKALHIFKAAEFNSNIAKE